MAYNYYRGNRGRMERIEDNERPAAAPPQRRQGVPAAPERPQRQEHGFAQTLSRLLPDKLGTLETEDIILLLILYLMYRDSGDSELLMIMGAMFLL